MDTSALIQFIIREFDIDYTVDEILEMYTKKLYTQNLPKKPLFAYVFFCRDNYAKIRAEQPGLTTLQISNELGKLWKTGNFDKQKYHEMARLDKERYDNEMANHQPL